jgi:hypothetical protein
MIVQDIRTPKLQKSAHAYNIGNPHAFQVQKICPVLPHLLYVHVIEDIEDIDHREEIYDYECSYIHTVLTVSSS